MSDDEERFFFVHLQKTAGTSLRIRLQHQFGEAAVYPDNSDGESVESAMSICTSETATAPAGTRSG